MSMRMKYQKMCDGCGSVNTTTCPIAGHPSAVVCKTCGAEYSTEDIETAWTSVAYIDKTPQASLPLNKRIKQPMSTAKARKYRQLEEAEQQRVRRMDHEDDD